MFIDKIKIEIQAGFGGAGCLSFRREKYIPFGGPHGGNGGKGGDIYLLSDLNLTTLLDLTYRPHFKAKSGDPGSSWNKAGRGAEDLYIRVPCGTVVWRSGELLGDLSEDKQTLLVAKGGRGGRGNAAFKTIRNTAPRISEKGEPGEFVELDLELKLIADVGFVGHPNAGKSTLLSRVSAAHPKIADYPFTTLSPNLGVVQFKNSSFVAADIPGLIEGAHTGKGLGLEFLRHVERTRILVHLVDGMGFDGKTPLENFKAIQKEISLYSKTLGRKPVLVLLTKMDCTGGKEELKKIKTKLKKYKVIGISAVTGEGMQTFLAEVVKMLKEFPKDAEAIKEAALPKSKKFVLGEEFSVKKDENGFHVKGRRVETLVAMTHFGQEEAVKRMQNILKKMGVEKLLQREGVQPGDLVSIGNIEFEYQPFTQDPA